MFGSVDIKCRPLVLACLVNPNDSRQVREAIRLNSTLWGGVYFPIVPLYKRLPDSWRQKPLRLPQAKEVILGYLDAFDPDVLVQFSPTVPEFIVETGLKIIKPEDVWAGAAGREDLSPQFGIGIFELLGEVFEKYFNYKTKYPAKVVLPEIPAKLSLFWSAWLGELPRLLMPMIEANYSEPLEIERPLIDQFDDVADLLRDNNFFPRRLTQIGLTSSYRSRSFRSASVFLLDAARLADVVDFWNLRALGQPVMPVPKQLRDNPSLTALVAAFLKSHKRRIRYSQRYNVASIIPSRSTKREEIKNYAETLSMNVAEPDKPLFALQHWYPQFWSEWDRDKNGEVPAEIYGDENESIEVPGSTNLTVRFPAVLPKFAYNQVFHLAPRCANEVSFRFYGPEERLAEAFPKSRGRNFDREISGFSFNSLSGEWRVGRNGLVRVFNGESRQTREVPLAENLYFAWLKDMGWNPQISTAGLLAKQMYKQLGGNPGALGNEKLLLLLERMNGGQVSRDGAPARENRLSEERFLSVGEVKRELKEASTLGNLHDYLISKGVFQVGLKIQCPRCQRNSWFSLEAIAKDLSCPKCLNVFPAIGNIDGAKWHYKTVGPFSVPKYGGGAYAVLLVSNFFGAHRFSMQTTPVLSFTATGLNGKQIEADFAMFWEESFYSNRDKGLLFAECKTYNEFDDKDWNRMQFLAETFPGSVLAFCTLRKSLSRREIAAITKLAKAGRKYLKPDHPINPILILTGAELFDSSPPPQCWTEAIQKKFTHIHGLLALCDATQQIYLNLPSWHDEWHAKWNKARVKLQRKSE